MDWKRAGQPTVFGSETSFLTRRPYGLSYGAK
jgi:hypothetical protein